MANQSNSDAELVETLAEFEKQLETPVVAGEMYDWAERGQTNLGTLAEKYADHIASSHESQFNEIVEQDSVQIPHVEKLRKEDAAILSDLARVGEEFLRVKKLVSAAEHAPQRDEAELTALIPPITGEALTLIIRIRMQENAIETWYMEAFERDRGNGD